MAGRHVPQFEIDHELAAHGLVHDVSAGRTGVFVVQSHEEGPFVYGFGEAGRSHELGNPDLPIFAHKAEIVEAVREHQVVLIDAKTGAGKSTQVPQFLLEDGYSRVTLTQPRRAAARNVYARIRAEIEEVRGGDYAERSVSYQTAGDSDGEQDAPISVVTDGLQLVRELHYRGTSPGEVLIIDEAHEWNGNIELLVGWVKAKIQENPDLRVVIMSATMDCEDLADFYEHVCGGRPPIIEADGRKYKIKEYERPESTILDEVMNVLLEVATGKEDPEQGNDILVFSPGKREINDGIDALFHRMPREVAKRVKVFPLHAKLGKEQQQAALKEYPGYIKVVYSTDVAQTSLTVPGIRYVFDSGLGRRIEIDEEGTTGLVMVHVSEADCKQRGGRVGRTAEGIYVATRLNNNTELLPKSERDKFPLPEMVRTDAARYTLQFLELDVDIAQFDFYHPASEHIIELGKEKLRLLGAIDRNGEITELGLQMCDYPLGVESARMAAESTNHRAVIRQYVAALAATREAGGLQYYSQDAGKEWESLTEETESDLLLQLDLYIAAQYMTRAQRIDYDLDVDNFDRAEEQYRKVAKISGTEAVVLQPPTEKQRQEILECIYAGFSPHIYKLTEDGKYVHAFRKEFRTPRELSNRSAVTGQPAFVLGIPYRVKNMGESGSDETHHFLESVTEVNAQVLANLALDHVEWRTDRFLMRGGKFRRVLRQFLFAEDQGIIKEVPAEPSPTVRAAVIEYTHSHPGYALSQLHGIKTELARLNRISKDPISLLTDEAIRKIVDQVADESVTSPSEIEDKIYARILDPAAGLRLDDFVSAERRKAIIDNAPTDVQVGPVKIGLKYSNHMALASRYSDDQILTLEDEVNLPDGRHVLFTRPNDARRYTLAELQERIRTERS